MGKEKSDYIRPSPSASGIGRESGWVATPAGGGSLGCRLENLIASALEMLTREKVVVAPEQGLMRQLRQVGHDLQNSGRLADFQRVNQQINDLHAYFNLADPDNPADNHGQLRVFTTTDKSRAFLVVTPPRGDGNQPTGNMLSALLERIGLVYGVDFEMIERVLEMVRVEHDIAWGAPIAQGVAPVAEQVGHVNFRVSVIDKAQFRRDPESMRAILGALGKPVDDEEVIGVISKFHAAAPGMDVFGRPINPPPPKRALELSDDIRQSPEGVLTARAPGYIVSNGARLDLLPFYVLTAAPESHQPELYFPGAVLVQGDFKGPMSLDCEDLFVLGNCEQVRVQARGDVFIAGGIIGHHQTTIDADGDVCASFISEASVSALGDIVIVNAIVNSRLVGNSRIHVTSDKGMIAGGNLAALKSITAATVGSEFGMFTETAVGRDFLSAARLDEIARHISMHAENLRRIQDLKMQVVRWHQNIENMPPDKQEILLNVLRKERNSQFELKSLARRRARLSSAISDFINASVQVVDNIYPPVRVTICNAMRDISEKLNAVILKYDERRGIIDEALRASSAGAGD